MKSIPSSHLSDSSAAFAPLPLTSSHAPSLASDTTRTHFPRSPHSLRRRKVIWDTSPIQHPVTCEILRCPTPIFLQNEQSPTKGSLSMQKTRSKSPISSTIRQPTTPDASKFYRFSRFPPYLHHTIDKKSKNQTPKSPHRFAFDSRRVETPQDPSNVYSKRPHSIFLELKSKYPVRSEVKVKEVEGGIQYRQEDLKSLRKIKQELRFLQRLREETYDKAVDDVLEEYDLQNIMEDELTYMNKEGNLFAKHLDGQVDATAYFNTIQTLQ